MKCVYYFLGGGGAGGSSLMNKSWKNYTLFFLECNPNNFFSSVGVQTCANSLVSPELSSDLVIFMCAVVNYNHVGIKYLLWS